MAGEQRTATSATDKRPVWSRVEKMASAALGVFIATMFTLVLGTWRTLGEHTAWLDVLVQPRPSGMTWTQQMQYNTGRIDNLLELLSKIDRTDARLAKIVEDDHRETERKIDNVNQRIHVIAENCAKLTGQVNGR